MYKISGSQHCPIDREGMEPMEPGYELLVDRGNGRVTCLPIVGEIYGDPVVAELGGLQVDDGFVFKHPNGVIVRSQMKSWASEAEWLAEEQRESDDLKRWLEPLLRAKFEAERQQKT